MASRHVKQQEQPGVTECHQHGRVTWRGTVACSGCGEPYRRVVRLGEGGGTDLVDYRAERCAAWRCRRCSAKLAAVLICGVCHATRVEGLLLAERLAPVAG